MIPGRRGKSGGRVGGSSRFPRGRTTSDKVYKWINGAVKKYGPGVLIAGINLWKESQGAGSVEPWDTQGQGQGQDLDLGGLGRPLGPGSVAAPGATTRLTHRVRPTGSGSTFSLFRGRRPVRRYRNKSTLIREVKALPWQMIRTVTTSRCQDVYSKQSVALFNIMDVDDFTAIKSYESLTNDGQIYLWKHNVSATMTNQSKANVFITMYEYIYRRDAVFNFSQLVTHGLSDVVSVSPPTFGTYGTTPFMSPTLGSNVKIQKVYQLELGQGRCHRHTSKYSYNDIFDYSYLSESSSDYLAGWSRGICIVCKGEPVNDQTTVASVVSAPTAVDIIWEKQLTFKLVPGNVRNLSYTMELPTTGITPYLMDEGSGEAEVVTAA